MLNKEKRSEINKLHHCVCMCECIEMILYAERPNRFIRLLMDVFGGRENLKRQQRAPSIFICVFYLHQAEMNIWH